VAILSHRKDGNFGILFLKRNIHIFNCIHIDTCKYESVYIDFKINAKRIEDNISFFIL
jgi:hypothetical protein